MCVCTAAEDCTPRRGPARPGPSALAASRVRGRRARALRPQLGARPRLRGPNSLVLVVFAVLLPVSAASPTTRGPGGVRRQFAVPQRFRADLNCTAGFYLSELSGKCAACTDGKDFTSHENALASCTPCSTCGPDKEEAAPCTRTKDAECRCKHGTFQDADSPEFCQKCSPKCPDGKVEAKTCTPWNDRECVDQESGSPWPEAGIAAGVVLAFLLLGLLLYRYRDCIFPGAGADTGNKKRAFFCCSCVRSGPEAQDNARNLIISPRNSSSTLASEQEPECQELTEVVGVVVPSPGETERLLGLEQAGMDVLVPTSGAAGADGSQTTRGRLVPANGRDPIETLTRFFDYFPDVVPFNSWRPLMRLMGLKNNDIEVARAQTTLNPREALYEMLMIWVNSTGQTASVNTLLDALEKLGDRNAKEKIQDHLVSSGEYVYEAGEAGPAGS